MHKSSIIVMLLTFGILLCVWAFVTGEGLISPLFLPSPGKVWHTFLTVAFGEGYQGASLWGHLGISMVRILVAFGVATVLAVPLGLLCGAIPLLRAAIAPIVHFYRPLPPLAYYTLLIIWFGIGEVSKVLLLFLAGFAPIFLACVAAVEHLDPAKLTAARTLGATGWRLFFYMILPSALPEIIVGLRTALGFIYTTLVAAEMVAAGSGVGWMVLDASKFLNSDVMVVGIMAMGVTGILLEAVFRLVERWWVPWKGKGG